MPFVLVLLLTYSKNSNFLFNSAFRVSKMHESADFMYIVAPYRFSVYAIGILLGFLLNKFQNTRLTQKQLNLGWLSAIACLIATLAICLVNLTYTPFNDAMFAGIGSITFCAFFAWIIFAAHLGHKSL